MGLIVTVDPDHQAALEQVVDEEIAKFDAWFQKRGNNEPLVQSERAILKTFLWFKTHPEQVESKE